MANEAGSGCGTHLGGATAYTYVSKGAPASIGGSVTALRATIQTPSSANTIQFGFFTASTNNLTSTDNTGDIALPDDASVQYCFQAIAPDDFTAFEVESGQYVGATSGDLIRSSTSGGSGMWYKSGDNIPCTNTAFTVQAAYLDGLGADITAAGGDPEAALIGGKLIKGGLLLGRRLV